MKISQIFIALFAVVVVISIIAFLILRPGPYSVENATGRDFVYSIEPRTNGTAVFWTHDSELGAYCVTNPTQASMLKNLAPELKKRRIELYFTYKSINNGSAAQQFVGTGCPKEDGGVTMYAVIDISEIINQ